MKTITKNLKNLMSIITLTLVMLVSINVSAQKSMNILNQVEFNESVAIIQDFTKVKVNASNILLIRVINFNTNKNLAPAYMINGLEYCDNGKFNDKKAGDGIYTSIKAYKVLKLESNSLFLNINENFKFEKELEKYNEQQNFNEAGKIKIKFGCKTRIANCPETNWWNDCWFGSPCTCIEFYDCEFEVETDVEF